MLRSCLLLVLALPTNLVLAQASKPPAPPTQPAVKAPAAAAPQAPKPPVPQPAAQAPSAPAPASQAVPTAVPSDSVPAKPQAGPPATDMLSLSKAFALLASEMTPTKENMQLALNLLKPYAHAIQANMIPDKADPAMAHIALRPANHIALAEQLLRNGALVQAQYKLQHLALYCGECHARASEKPNWRNLSAPNQLTEYERAEFYKLGSRLSDALLSYERVINSPGIANSRPDIWEKTGMSLVGMSIKTQDSPYLFVDILSNSVQSASLSKAQKDLINRWRGAGKTWDKEPPARGAQEAMQKVTIFFGTKQAGKGSTAIVENARVMNLLRFIQREGSTPLMKAQAFQKAAQLREQIGVNGVWLPAEDFYEACIRIAPRTAEAKSCFTQLRSLPQREKRLVLADISIKELQALAP